MHRDMGTEIRMTRASVFWLRLAPTATLALLVYALLRLFWYPEGYFELFGTGKLFVTLAAVVFVIGPGLSTLLFRPGKKGLVFDLVVIALVEVFVFAWALTVLHARQPSYAVFAVDRVEAVRRGEVDLDTLAFPELARRPGHSPRLVYAELPTDSEGLSRLIDETVFLGMPDIDRRPEFWRPYPQGVSTLQAVAKPVSELLAPGDSRALRIRRWFAANSKDPDDYVYLPVKAARGDGTMLLHASVGYPVAVLAVDPW